MADIKVLLKDDNAGTPSVRPSKITGAYQE